MDMCKNNVHMLYICGIGIVLQYNPYGELKSYHYTDNRRNINQTGGIIAGIACN